jgi:ubiquinone/menaquinone biosynthesis C-methylase UbiE
MGSQFDEAKHAGPEHLDPAYVAKYDSKARTDPTEDVKRLKDFGLGVDSVVLDFGAGTGTFAAAIAPLCKKVIAVDVSPAMISAMRAKIEKVGWTNVEIVESGFLNFEAPSRSIDFVYSRNALHSLPNDQKMQALKKVADLLKPLGILYLKDLVYSFPKEAESYLKAWLEAAPAHPEDGWTREELETHIKTEFSSYSDELEEIIDQAGFEIRDANHRDNKIFSAYICRKKLSPSS